MMARMLMLCGIAAGALLQLFLPAWPLFGGMKPPVLAAFAIYYALRCTPRDMWIGVFFAALLQDGLDLGRFGPALLAFPIIGWLAHRVRLEIFVDGLVTQMVFGALGAMVATLVAVLVYAVTGQRPFHFGGTLLRIFGSGLMGMATLPLVARTMGWLETLLPKRRGYGWQ